MVLIPLVPTMATVISNWRELMFIITKPQAANMSHVLYSSILNPEPWIQSDRVPTDKFSDQTTLFSDNRGQETTGPKDTTQKVKFKY